MDKEMLSAIADKAEEFHPQTLMRFIAALRAAAKLEDEADRRAIVSTVLEVFEYEGLYLMERWNGGLRPGGCGLKKALKRLL